MGGTHKPETGSRCWGRQQGLGSLIYMSRWGNGLERGPGPFLEQVENHVRLQNLKLLTKTVDTCPFRKGCLQEGNPPLPDKYNYSYSSTMETSILRGR